MHHVSLEFKRAHWAAVAATRPLAAEYSLTPARFDLLYVVFERLALDVGQIGIARQLGVSGATVARMLKSLEQLRLVRRRPAMHDRRQKHVSLTARGRAIMREAVSRLVDGRLVHRMYQGFFELGQRALAAAQRASSSETARAAYRAERARERYDVLWEIEAAFGYACLVGRGFRRAQSQPVYRIPLPPG